MSLSSPFISPLSKKKHVTTPTTCAKPHSSRGRHARVIFFFITFRIARSWNQTGVKWAHLPGFREWIIQPNQQFFLFFLLLASFLYVGDSFRRVLVQHARHNMKKSMKSTRQPILKLPSSQLYPVLILARFSLPFDHPVSIGTVHGLLVQGQPAAPISDCA